MSPDSGPSSREGAVGDPFERLNRASVALLDPLLEPDGAVSPEGTAARLGEAIMHCAQVADAVGLRSLNYLATLMVPFLQREAGTAGWPAARERVEGWIAQVIAFCAGHASAAEAEQLVLDLQLWPGFPAVPAQFVNLITGRLREDAALVGELADGLRSAPALAVAPAPGSVAADVPEASHQPVGPEGLAAAEGRAAQEEPAASSAAPTTVARDELEMLLEAVDGLEDEILEPLRAITLPPEPGAVALVTDLADLCRERLGNLAGAMRYVGLEPAADFLEPCRESLAAWRDVPASAGPEVEQLLRGLALALSAFFRAPGESTLAALQAASGDARWPVRARDAGEGRPGALREIAVIGSRRVEAAGRSLEAEDVSLAVPEDADASVLDNLLRELPGLAAEFSMHVERLVSVEPAEAAVAAQDRAADREALAAARRIAHTLKGAANTVGIRGIATLTHRLEDLLQLLGDRDESPDGATRAVLSEAADCLGEMTDAVAGLGDGPVDAMGVCRSLGELIDRWLSPQAAQPEAVPPVVSPEGAPPVVSPLAAPHQAAAPEVSPEAAQPEATAGAVTEQAPLPGPVAPAAQLATAPGGGADAELLRVPAALLDRVLDLAGEASILLARVQEQVDQLGDVRQAFRVDSDRLRDLAGELERLVDIRGVTVSGRRGRSDFDSLELDDYNELHTVSRRIGEAGADARVLDQQLDRQGAGLAEAVGQLERVQTDLREAVMQSRMVPVRSVLPRLQRVVRQAARITGKAVELRVTGEETDVDARLLQALLDPIGHLLRNAVDHGIEASEERIRAGKPPAGLVTLSFRRDGRRLSILCVDDGRGLDLDAIRSRALQAGLLDPEARPDDSALARIVLQPGFSTRAQATQISGRGIGLDVVQRAVRELRGEMELSPAPGAGLQVRIEVPEGMVAIPVVVVRTPSHVLALSIRGVERIVPADGAVRDDAGALRFVDEGGVLPAFPLDEMIGLPAGFFAREAEAARLSGSRRAASARQAAGGEVALLVRRAGAGMVAVIAPSPGQTRSVVVRPLPPWLPAIAAVEGATVLGDGAVATVLDLPALVSLESPLAATRLPEGPAPRLPLCLVADDSVSVRRSMELFLQDLGFEVESAGDGVDALALAQRRVPALAIVDLEMPRMNGVELCRALRDDPRTRAVPVIMITSRSSDRHRALALDAGVDVFLTKPYSEDELGAEIRRCLVGRPAVG